MKLINANLISSTLLISLYFKKNVWGTRLLRRIRKKRAKRQKCLGDRSHMIIVTFVQFFFYPKTYQRFSTIRW